MKMKMGKIVKLVKTKITDNSNSENDDQSDTENIDKSDTENIGKVDNEEGEQHFNGEEMSLEVIFNVYTYTDDRTNSNQKWTRKTQNTWCTRWWHQVSWVLYRRMPFCSRELVSE